MRQTDSPNVTVLLTGIGAPGAPGVIRSLRLVQDRAVRIVGVDMNPLAPGRFLADHFETVPGARESDFIATVAAICRKQRVDVVLPLVTGELIKFAEASPAFLAAGTVVSVSRADALRLAIDKGRLFAALRAAHMAVPRHVSVTSGPDLLRALRDLGYPDQEVCFKPSVGDGGRGFHRIVPPSDRLQSLFAEKSGSYGVTYDEIERLVTAAGAHDIPEVLAMEYLPGREYSVDLLADHGRVLVAVPRLREQTAGGVTTTGVTCMEEDVIRYASDVVARLGLHGNIGVQARRDRDGGVRIVEVNPRIQGSIVHCTASGVNLPYLAVRLALGPPPLVEPLDVKWGVRMQRYFAEVYSDADGGPCESGGDTSPVTPRGLSFPGP